MSEHDSLNKHKSSAKIQKDNKILPYVAKNDLNSPTYLFIKALIKDAVPLNVIDNNLGQFARLHNLTLPTAHKYSINIVDQIYDAEFSNLKELVKNGQLISVIVNQTPDTFRRPTV